MTALLTENLPLLSGAPNGIKKLRKLILELAVRGKLLPQDLSDEPASALLKRISEEKAMLLSEGKIRKQKDLGDIAEPLINFPVPLGWEVTTIGEAMICRDGERIPVSQAEREGREKIYDYYGASGVIDKIDGYLFDKPLLLVGEDGANLINRSTPIAFIARGSYWVNNHAHVLDGINEQLLRYVELYFNAIDLKPYVTGTAQPKMNQAKMNGIPLPLPPEREQHRIVTKVDELMALCDRLEAQQADAESAHAQLVQALLDSLTQTSDATDFAASWQRLAKHFYTLFTTESSIDALKKTLLQLAVMGKLVPQDLGDEPASELLKQIAKKKEQLVAGGEIKKQKALAEIAEEETPFEKPGGWSWVRLEALTKVITKGSSPKWQGISYTDNPNDILFVTSENVGSYKLRLDSKKYVERAFNSIEPRSILHNGDFLMNIVGASIGRTAIFDVDTEANINQAVCLIRSFSDFLSSQFLLHFFNSEICLSYMFDKQVDNARANLSMGNIANFVLPIPPLAEQHRIVTKVDQLMTLCDQLKTRLTQARQLNEQLANTLVEQAVA